MAATYAFFSKGVKVKQLSENRELSLKDFEPTVGIKDGTHVLRGPCDGNRSDANMSTADVLIIDGDSSFDFKTGEVNALSAPPAKLAHEALKALGLSHVVHTTHSHQQNGKGNRWRAFVWTNRPYTKGELEACNATLHEAVQLQGCTVTQTKESGAFGQPWYLPRVPSEEALADFEYYVHNGKFFCVGEAVAAYAKEQKVVSTYNPRMGGSDDVIGAYVSTHSLADLLRKHGYEQKAWRKWLSPNSTSGNPGVHILGGEDGRPEILYSHHGDSDPLADGEAHDVFDVFGYLEHGNGKAAVHAAAVEMGMDYKSQSGKKNHSKAEPLHVDILAATDIQMEPIDWLWHYYLARGKLHLIAGQAGTGKTTIALDMAATVTVGGQWPDSLNAEKGGVLIWSGEDDPADSLIPRLSASGADIKRVFFVGDTKDKDGDRSFDPATDMNKLLESTSRIEGLSLIIVDPIVSAVAGDSHKNAEVRRALQPLVDLASKVGAAILGITHFTKGTKGNDPTERVTGSLAFAALARIVMCTVKPLEEGENRRFIRSKSNIGPDGGGFEYSLTRKDVQDGIEGQTVAWGNVLDGTAHELMAAIEDGESDTSSLDEAKDWLRHYLENEGQPSASIKKASAADGHSWATIKRAKAALGAYSIRINGAADKGCWVWDFPARKLCNPP